MNKMVNPQVIFSFGLFYESDDISLVLSLLIFVR